MLLQGFLRNKVIFLQISMIWSYHVHPSVPCNLILVCLHLCVNSGVSRSWVTCMALRQMCMLCSSIGMPLAWKLWVRSALVGPTLKLSSRMMVWRWTKWWAWGGTEAVMSKPPDQESPGVFKPHAPQFPRVLFFLFWNRNLIQSVCFDTITQFAHWTKN